MTLDGRVARERFAIGDRVRLSLEGVATLIKNPTWRDDPVPTMGVVCGFGREYYIVRVRRDGRSEVSSYHEKFWEHETTDAQSGQIDVRGTRIDG